MLQQLLTNKGKALFSIFRYHSHPMIKVFILCLCNLFKTSLYPLTHFDLPLRFVMYQYSSRFTLTAISNVKEVENVVVHIQSFIT